MRLLTHRVELVTGLKATEPKEAEDYQVIMEANSTF